MTRRTSGRSEDLSSWRKDSTEYPLGDLLVLGDLCLDVDAFVGRREGHNHPASEIRFCEGGSGGNVAFMADQLGLKTGLAAPISDDSAGVLLESLVRHRHRKVRLHLLKDPMQVTCVIVNLIDGHGVRRAYFKKNEGNCKIQNLRMAASKFRAIHMSGYTLELFDIGEVCDFVHGVRTHGVEVTLDLFPRIGLMGASKAELGRIFGDLEFLFGNTQEFSDLTGSSRTKDIIQDFAKRGTDIVIKRGSKGAIFSGRNGVISSPPSKVRPVSLKGAGDVFVAGFLASHLKGYDVQQALNAANRLAGMHIAGKDNQIVPKSVDELSSASSS